MSAASAVMYGLILLNLVLAAAVITLLLVRGSKPAAVYPAEEDIRYGQMPEVILPPQGSVYGTEAVARYAKLPAYADRQKSLDRQFAEANGLWVCECCETVNVQSAGRCAACGSLR